MYIIYIYVNLLAFWSTKWESAMFHGQPEFSYPNITEWSAGLCLPFPFSPPFPCARSITLPRQGSLGFEFRQHRFQHLGKQPSIGRSCLAMESPAPISCTNVHQCHLRKKCSKLLNYYELLLPSYTIPLSTPIQSSSRFPKCSQYAIDTDSFRVQRCNSIRIVSNSTLMYNLYDHH